MKPIYTTPLMVLAFVFFTFFPKHQVLAQAPTDHSFSIHIGTFVKAQLSDFDNIHQLGFIYAEKFQNNLLQVYLGEFPSEAAARQLIDQIRTSGYPDAYISRRNLQQGEKVYIIQLASLKSGNFVNWADFAKAGPMYALLRGQQVLPATGIFDHVEEAHQRLTIVKKLGYTAASVVPINNIYLHEISSFETSGDLASPEVELVVEAPVIDPPAEMIPESYDEVLVSRSPEAASKTTSTASPDKASSSKEITPITVDIINTTNTADPTPPPVEIIPESYDEVLVSRSPEAAVETPEMAIAESKKSNKIAAPNIRAKVKRTSAIELQKVLKKEGTYKGSLDGYYGKGTREGYTQIMASHPDIQKYKMLAKHNDQWQEKGAGDKDQLSEWESLHLVRTIAKELDPNPANSQSMMETFGAIRTAFLAAPKALSKEEQKAIITWNTSLWTGLDAWTEKDPIHQKMTIPLKVAYYQSMALLEDHFMDQKFKPLEAKGMALSILQTIVAPYLESYRM